MQDIFATFSDADAGTTYAHALAAFDKHFNPKQNPVFERHLFRQMCRLEYESTLQFVTRLRTQAEHCGFGNADTEHIRDQAIDKCNDRRLKGKYLVQGDLTLDQLLKIARAHEDVIFQVKTMSGDSQSTDEKIVGDVGSSSGSYSQRRGQRGADRFQRRRTDDGDGDCKDTSVTYVR